MVRQRKNLLIRIRSVLLSFIISIQCVFTLPLIGEGETVYGGEIIGSLVGAISGNLTVWDLVTTLMAGAGFVIVNNDIQQNSLQHLGGSDYTFNNLLSQGLIEVDDAKPTSEWNWSGLQNLMSDWGNYIDSQPLVKIQNAYNEISGGNFGNLWIDYLKKMVHDGYITAGDIASNIGATIYDFCAAVGRALGINVSTGQALDESLPDAPPNALGIVLRKHEGELYRLYYCTCASADVTAIPYVARVSGGNKLAFMVGNRGTGDTVYRYYYKFADGVTVSNNTSINRKTAKSLFEESISNTDTFYPPLMEYADAQAEIQKWMNGDDVTYPLPGVNGVESPDILTNDGMAVPSEGTWAPDPWLGGLDWPDAWLKPIPEGVYRPAIDGVIEGDIPAEDFPDVIGDITDGYIGADDIDIPGEGDEAVPTVIPRPTAAVADGTIDYPYFVNEADPIPDMEKGKGKLPGLENYFPFCIPGDFVYIANLFNSKDNIRKALVIRWPLEIPSLGLHYDITCDLSVYDDLSDIFRMINFIAFCVGLLFITKSLIWK